jgi:hypothetical protein
VGYTHDLNGNRIQRYFIGLKEGSNSGDIEGKLRLFSSIGKRHFDQLKRNEE